MLELLGGNDQMLVVEEDEAKIVIVAKIDAPDAGMKENGTP